MSEKVKYDPVTAPVPGVDPAARQQEINAFHTAGDPIAPSEPKVTSKKSKLSEALEKLGITIS